MTVYLVCELGCEECEHIGVFGTLPEAQASRYVEMITALEIGAGVNGRKTWYRVNTASEWRECQHD